MSDDPILAALARLEAGQEQLRADLGGRIDRLRADLMARMDRLQGRLDNVNEHNTLAYGEYDKVDRRIEAVAADNRTLSEQLRTLERIVRNLEGRINQIEEKP